MGGVVAGTRLWVVVVSGLPMIGTANDGYDRQM